MPWHLLVFIHREDMNVSTLAWWSESLLPDMYIGIQGENDKKE